MNADKLWIHLFTPLRDVKLNMNQSRVQRLAGPKVEKCHPTAAPLRLTDNYYPLCLIDKQKITRATCNFILELLEGIKYFIIYYSFIKKAKKKQKKPNPSMSAWPRKLIMIPIKQLELKFWASTLPAPSAPPTILLQLPAAGLLGSDSSPCLSAHFIPPVCVSASVCVNSVNEMHSAVISSETLK